MRLGRIPWPRVLRSGCLPDPDGGALADPKPTVSQAKAKLKKLNDKADKVVDRYNTATEKYKTAKGRYTKLNESYRRKLATVADLREQVVSMAVDSYKMGGDFAGAAHDDHHRRAR